MEEESAYPKEDVFMPSSHSEPLDKGASARPLSPVILPDAPMKSVLKKPGRTKRYKKQASLGNGNCHLLRNFRYQFRVVRNCFDQCLTLCLSSSADVFIFPPYQMV